MTYGAKSDWVFKRSKTYPSWVFLSLAANGLLMGVIVWLLRDYWWPVIFQVNASTAPTTAIAPLGKPGVGLGQVHRLTYEGWVNILQQEANAAAQNPPQDLTILAGDSLSLWFPPDLLPLDRSWLNQGISGETSAGLLKRLKLFDRVQPTTIFVMIGINDLLRGITDESLLWNQRLIVRRLRRVHPQAQIVVQSILPHQGENATWEGRDRLKAIPNSRIQEINRNLEALAREERVRYLDVHPLFTDEQGNLRSELTTDGLHLSRQGYLVWRSALQMFAQLKLEIDAVK